MGAEQDRKVSFLVFGLLLAGIPLALLVVPLFFHAPVLLPPGEWTAVYRKFVFLACATALFVAAFAGVVSYRTQRLLMPLYLDFLVVLGVVLLCASELILTRKLRAEDPFAEFRQWGHKRSAFFGFEAAPNNSWGEGRYSTDRFGFRSHPGNSWEGQKGPRIFAVGESSTFGYGLDSGQTWAHLLEQGIRAKFHEGNINVVNAGNNAFNVLQVLLKYHLRIRPHRPDTLIFYGARNDIFGEVAALDASLFMNDAVLTSPSLLEFWAQESAGQNIYARTLTFYYLAHEAPFLSSLQSWQRASADRPGLVAVALAAGGSALAPRASRVEAVLAELAPGDSAWRDYIERNGREVFSVHLQALCTLAKDEGTRVVLTTFLQDFGPHNRLGVTVRVYNEYVRELAQKNGLPLVDLEQRFEPVPNKADYFFEDHYHPSAKGAQFIAEALTEAWQPEWLAPLQ